MKRSYEDVCNERVEFVSLAALLLASSIFSRRST